MMIAELFAKLGIKPDKRSFDAADGMIGAVKTALVGLAAFAAGRFLGGMVEDTVELGGKLNDLSVQTNTNVEDLQALGFAAKQNGAEMEDVSGTLTKLNKNIYEAANGNKAMAASFAKAGISVREADGSLRPASDVLSDIANHLQSIPAESRVGVAVDLLGKSGAKLIPTLAGGSAELEKMKQEARDLGAVISEDGVTQLDDFGDEVDKAKAALLGVRNEAVLTLLPEMKKLLDQFMAWVKANKQLIAQKLEKLLKILVKGFQIFGSIVSVTVDVLTWAGKHIDLITVAVIALTAAILIFKAESIAAAIASAVAWVIAEAPLILLAIAIAAVILLIEDLYQWFTGGESVLKDFWGFFKEWAGDKLKAIWQDNVDFFKMIWDGVINWIEGKLEWLWDKAKSIKDFITGENDPIGQQLFKAQMAFAARPNAENRKALDEAQNLQDISNGDAAAPSISVPSSESGGGVQITVHQTVEGSLTGTPEENAKAMTDGLNKVMDDHLRAAAIGVGGVK